MTPNDFLILNYANDSKWPNAEKERQASDASSSIPFASGPAFINEVLSKPQAAKIKDKKS